jgi:hypothetical protein
MLEREDLLDVSEVNLTKTKTMTMTAKDKLAIKEMRVRRKERKIAKEREDEKLLQIQAEEMALRIANRIKAKEFHNQPPADASLRRTIGYGWSKVPSNGQRFRGHCGR